MKRLNTMLSAVLLCGASAFAQTGLQGASAELDTELEANLRKLEALTNEIADEKLPLNEELRQVEEELERARADFQETTRQLEKSTLDITGLTGDIKRAEDETAYLTGLLGEYMRNFESRLHIIELQRYREVIDAARLALENGALPKSEVYKAQAELLSTSLDRTLDVLGGTAFEGTALDSDGLVTHGSFVLLGPAAIFRSGDGDKVGTIGQLLNSNEPSQLAFGNPADAEMARSLITSRAGSFPLDPTLGNAHKIEATQETFLEHVRKGGAVMIPIFAMAAAALLVALWKWLSLAMIGKPSREQIAELLGAVERGDHDAAGEVVREMKGPAGEMLAAGVEHLGEPTELIEEVMYETVLTSRLKVNSLLPFVSICAASAPLLGLLGTVTGIINTFKLITVFGSGDVKMLSGGISEALITTKFGLIVAIPSLLLHAFLSRQARGVIAQMEGAAVTFVNQVSKARSHGADRDRTIPAARSPRSSETEAPLVEAH